MALQPLRARPREEEREQLEPVNRESLTYKAYVRIRAALMLSKFKPGERLALRPLAAELGISPTPVREALLRLVSEHALALDARGVVSVPVFDPAEYVEVRDLRIALEGQAAAEAAAHVTAADIARLTAADRRFREAGKRSDFAAAWEANERFHMGVYGLAGKPVLLSLIESLWMRCGPFFLRMQEGGLGPGSNQHQNAIRALAEGDGDGARVAIGNDIMAGWRRLTGAE